MEINYDELDEKERKEYKLILSLKEKYDLNNPDDVDKLYSKMLSGTIEFKTGIGRAFDDEIFELKSSFDNNKVNNKTTTANKATNKATNKAANKVTNKDTNKVNTKRKSDDMASGKRTVSAKNKHSESRDTYSEEMDSVMKERVLKEINRQNKKRTLVVALLSVASVILIGYFVVYYAMTGSSERRLQNIAELVGSDALASGPTSVTATLTDDDGITYEILSKYQTLYNSNKKLIGWIKIDDTNIDYPVMQCGDNEFYLNHNFDSEEDMSGALFLDCSCDAARRNDNFIIYGHHLSSGRMFGDLPKYESESYYKDHRYIRFDTIYEEHVYEVMFVFRSRVYNEEDVNFKYYQFIDANSEEEFNSYMNEMSSLSFYDTGVWAYYGDELLTLSTCDYHEENGRFVVVAKRIS